MNIEKNKYIDIVFSIIAIGYIIWLIADYDNLVYDDHMPTGKAAKKMTLLLMVLDKAIGKIWTLAILSLLAVPFIFRSFKNIYVDIKKKMEKRQ